MRKTIVVFGMGLLLMTLASPAKAAQIDWTGTGSGAWATFSLAGNPLGSPFSDFVGELTWNWIGAPPAGYSSSFFSYCVDATQYLTDPQTVAVSSTSSLTGASQSHGLVVAGGGTDAGGKIAWLYNQYATEAHADGIGAAALQIAIWEALYDASPDLDNGTFTLVNNPAYGGYSAIKAKASADLASLYSKPVAGGGYTYYTGQATFLDTPAGQDQVTGSPVPEPSSMMLLGGGAIALMAKRRKRAAARSAEV